MTIIDDDYTKSWKLIKTYLKVDSLLYFASNVKFKTSAESWLVTMIMVAARVAPMASSLSKRVKILLVLVIGNLAFDKSSEDENGSLGES